AGRGRPGNSLLPKTLARGGRSLRPTRGRGAGWGGAPREEPNPAASPPCAEGRGTPPPGFLGGGEARGDPAAAPPGRRRRRRGRPRGGGLAGGRGECGGRSPGSGRWWPPGRPG